MKKLLKFFINKHNWKKYINFYIDKKYKFKGISIQNVFKKKIAIISMVKNESSIIEHFIRVNLLWASHIFIIDDSSGDDTLSIIKKLKDEGLPISFLSNQSIDYQQNTITTNLMRSVAALDIFDFIVPLDADEFIFESSDFIHETSVMNDGSIGLLNWKSLIPTILDLDCSKASLLNQFECVKSELRTISKVVIPNSLAKNGYLTMGNHDFYIEGNFNLDKIIFNTKIFHAPIRSKDQIISKIIIGANKFSIKKNKSKGEGSHWKMLYSNLFNLGFELTLYDLRLLSYCYVSQNNVFDSCNIEKLPFKPPNYPIVYTKLNGNLLTLQLNSFIQELSSKIESV